MEVEGFVRVELIVEYAGLNEYRIQVLVDGRVEEILPAYDYNVARVRNQACARWSECADEVKAGEIPPASDMQRCKTLRYDGVSRKEKE